METFLKKKQDWREKEESALKKKEMFKELLEEDDKKVWFFFLLFNFWQIQTNVNFLLFLSHIRKKSKLPLEVNFYFFSFEN